VTQIIAALGPGSDCEVFHHQIDLSVGEPMAETPSDFAYAYDLTLDEARRRTAVLEAIEGDWDPVGVLAGEELAWDMLYSGLDDDQQRIYDELVSAGVLPDRAVNRVAHCSRCRPRASCVAAVPALRPRQALHRLPQHPQLRRPLAVPAEQPGLGRAPAMPDLRPSLDDRHFSAPPSGLAQGRLTVTLTQRRSRVRRGPMVETLRRRGPARSRGRARPPARRPSPATGRLRRVI